MVLKDWGKLIFLVITVLVVICRKFLAPKVPFFNSVGCSSSDICLGFCCCSCRKLDPRNKTHVDRYLDGSPGRHCRGRRLDTVQEHSRAL